MISSSNSHLELLLKAPLGLPWVLAHRSFRGTAFVFGPLFPRCFHDSPHKVERTLKTAQVQVARVLRMNHEKEFREELVSGHQKSFQALNCVDAYDRILFLRTFLFTCQRFWTEDLRLPIRTLSSCLRRTSVCQWRIPGSNR